MGTSNGLSSSLWPGTLCVAFTNVTRTMIQAPWNSEVAIDLPKSRRPPARDIHAPARERHRK